MNKNIYIEERIEDIYPKRNSNEANEAIKELLENNSNLQEEVRNLKREQEIQSVNQLKIHISNSRSNFSLSIALSSLYTSITFNLFSSC